MMTAYIYCEPNTQTLQCGGQDCLSYYSGLFPIYVAELWKKGFTEWGWLAKE